MGKPGKEIFVLRTGVLRGGRKRALARQQCNESAVLVVHPKNQQAPQKTGRLQRLTMLSQGSRRRVVASGLKRYEQFFELRLYLSRVRHGARLGPTAALESLLRAARAEREAWCPLPEQDVWSSGR
jgi:hypothetical protein